MERHPAERSWRGTEGEARFAASPQPLGEKFDQEKRILLTRSEAAALDRLVSSLASRLNSQVKLSHVLRSLITLLLNAEREVDKRAGETPGLVRPAKGWQGTLALQKGDRPNRWECNPGCRSAKALAR